MDYGLRRDSIDSIDSVEEFLIYIQEYVIWDVGKIRSTGHEVSEEIHALDSGNIDNIRNKI